MSLADIHATVRLHHVHHNWLRRLGTGDASRPFHFCGLGVVGSRHDDDPHIRFVECILPLLYAYPDRGCAVLSEAYSFSYRHALLHTHVFDNAVKRYRQGVRTQQQSKRLSEHQRSQSGSDMTHSNTPQPFEHPRNHSTGMFDHVSSRSGSPTGERHIRAQHKLETLPFEILQHARMFHEQVQYFITFGKTTRHGDTGVRGILGSMPQGVKELLSDIAGPGVLGDKIIADIIQDDNVRKVLSQSLHG